MTPLLVIENERPMQRLLAWALQQEGFEVELVGPEAVRPAAVAIVNAGVPAAERRSLVQTMRGHRARTIALVADEEPDGASGADAEVRPPYRMEDIVRVIARLRVN